MKLKRFQVALNHEDPNIVIQGLNEFTDTILQEHNAIESFGYHGRSLSSYQELNLNHPAEIKGLLNDYLASSPQIEELFVLWKISGRNEKTDLIVSHTQCLAAILYCAKSYSKCCDRIVARILSEFSRPVSNQLTLGHIGVVHSTLGLLIAMCSSSSQNCRDTYQKLINHLSPLQTLLQKGKLVSTEIAGVRVQTDSRHLIVILVLVGIYHSDMNMGNELIASRGLFHRVVNGIHKDTSDTVSQVIHGLLEIMKSSTVPDHIKVNIVDATFLTKVLSLSDEHMESSKKLLSTYSHLLVSGKSVSVVQRMNLLIKTLSPHTDIFHRELIMILLKAKPLLISRCLNAIPISWDQPVLSYSYVSSLSYICYLLDATDIDHNLLHSFSSSTKIASLSDSDVKNVVTELCNSLLPTGTGVISSLLTRPGLTKKDLSRLLQHSSPLLRRMGFILYLRLLQRIKRSLAMLESSTHLFTTVQGHLTSLLTNIFPDIQLLLSARARSVTCCIQYINCGDNTEFGKSQLEESFYFHSLIMNIFETMIATIPTFIQAQNPSFDFCKFLDDIFPWSSTSSVGDTIGLYFSSSHYFRELYSQMLLHTIKVLRAASVAEQCAWFGSKSDCVKVFTNLFVSPSWENFKHSPLQKLLLIAAMDVDIVGQCHRSLISSAQDLLSFILDQSHLFDGHGKMIVEMAAERDSWFQVIRRSVHTQRTWLYLMDILLRISHHWDLELCFDASQRQSEVNDSKAIMYCVTQGVLPFSPILYASLHLLVLNFNPFQNQFPKFIQNHIKSFSQQNSHQDGFFTKYISGFRCELYEFLTQVIFTLFPYIPDPSSYLCFLDNISQSLSATEIVVTLFSDVLSCFDSSLPSRPSTFSDLSDDMSINTMSFLSMNQNYFSQGNLSCVSESFINRWWSTLATVILLQRKFSPSFINWLINYIEKEEKQILKLSLSRKICLMSLNMRLLSFFTVSTSTNDNLGQHGLNYLSDICRKLTMLVINILISVKSPSTVFEVLDSCLQVPPESPIPHFMQQILVSAAVTLLKEKNKKYPKWDEFWRKIFQSLLTHPIKDDLHTFCLSWSLQGVISDKTLHSSLVTHCIGDGIDQEGYVLLALSRTKGYQLSIKIPPLVESILQSGSLISLSNAANKLCLDYITHREFRPDLLSNALCHLSFTINHSIFSISNYCEVLSIGLDTQITDAFRAYDHSINQLQRIQRLVSLSPTIQYPFWHPICKLTYFSFPLSKSKATVIADVLTRRWIISNDTPRGHHIWNSIETFISAHISDQGKLSLLRNFKGILTEQPILLSNILPLFLSCPEAIFSKLLFHFLFPIILSSPIAQSFSFSWSEIYCQLLQCLLEDAIELLKESKSSCSCLDELAHLFDSLLLLIEVSFVDDLISKRRSELIDLFNKCLKLCLKYGLDKLCSLNFLFHFARIGQGGTNILHQLSSDNALQSESLLLCHQLLEMIISHSKFLSLIQLESSTFLSMMRLLLILLSQTLTQPAPANSACLEFLMKSLFPLYKATVSYADRIIFRILYLSQEAVNLMSNGSELKLVDQIFSFPLPHYAPNVDQSDNFQWVTHALTPPVVYYTLTTFPSWRSITPAIFEFEPITAVRKAEVIKAWHHEESDDLIEDEASSMEQILIIDWFEGNSHSLDPAYWLPALHCCLSNSPSLSMRLFANCGALALTIAALGSQCRVIRVYARSCLQLIYEILLTQTPDKDSAFKERPQLILLVSFIRNYFTDSDVKESERHSQLPVSQALFLARSALHLLQPQHTLYSGANKYLLAKPYCDVKDIPLYDALVMSADLQADSNQRISALRLIRDSLMSYQDHLNMCRKHAYPRLMTSFLLFSKDPKVSHSILDIFDKALSISPSASRYLIDRCGFIPWLQHVCSNLNSLTSSRSPHTSTSDKESVKYGSDAQHEILPFLLAAPLRMIGRVACLIRKSLGVLSLLQTKGIETAEHQQSIFVAAMSIVGEILLIRSFPEYWKDSYVPIELLKQTVLLLWDLLLFASSQGSDSKKLLRFVMKGNDIFQLAQICQDGRKSYSKVEYDDLEISLFSLLAFRNMINFDSSSSISGLRLMEYSLSQWTLGHHDKGNDTNVYCLFGDAVPSMKRENNEVYLPPPPYFSDQHQTLSHSAGQALADPSMGIASIEACAKEIEYRNWNAYCQYNLENSPLPSKLGNRFLIFSIIRAVLSVICSGYDNMDSSLYVRWSLLMKKSYYDTTIFYETNTNPDETTKIQVCQRIFSSFDDGYIDDYTAPYEHYLFGYHCTVIGLLSFLESNFVAFSEAKQHKEFIGHSVWNALEGALCTLLRTSPCSSIEFKSKARDLCDHAKFFWNEGDQDRCIILQLICQSCDLISIIYTLGDRTSPPLSENLSIILNTSTLSNFGEILQRKSQIILQYCKSYSPSPSRISHDLSESTIWDEDIYESNSNTLKSFLYDTSINYDQYSSDHTDIPSSSTQINHGLDCLLEKMNFASSNYSLLGKKLISMKENENKRLHDDNDEEEEEKNNVEFMTKRRKFFHSLQYTFSIGRKGRYQKSLNNKKLRCRSTPGTQTISLEEKEKEE